MLLSCFLFGKFRYMIRRCRFLEDCTYLQYNMGVGPCFDAEGKTTGKFNDIKQLRSVLVDVMKDEVENLCNPTIAKNWELSTHSQVLCWCSA